MCSLVLRCSGRDAGSFLQLTSWRSCGRQLEAKCAIAVAGCPISITDTCRHSAGVDFVSW